MFRMYVMVRTYDLPSTHVMRCTRVWFVMHARYVLYECYATYVWMLRILCTRVVYECRLCMRVCYVCVRMRFMYGPLSHVCMYVYMYDFGCYVLYVWHIYMIRVCLCYACMLCCVCVCV